jgi:UDPglucose 6-dehydrogenase
MKSIAVIGQGFVGGSLTTGMSHAFAIHACDIGGVFKPGATTKSQNTKFLVKQTEEDSEFTNVYFVCLPTPMYEDGEADLRIVENALRELSETISRESIAVVKSTIPPGSTERWNELFKDSKLTIVFNPEFLTEANALDDFKNQNRIVVGGPRPYSGQVKQVFQTAFPKVPIIKTSSTNAEMIKYVTNCFLATKVSFANEMAQIVEALDADGMNIDYDKVIEYARYDKRLGDSHWSVPGPVATHDGRYVRGFGGHCFPKDLNALKFVANKLGVETTVLDGVWEKNLEVRGPEDRDWEHMKDRAVSEREK